MKPAFRPGSNIAIKTPAHEFEATIIFYRDILGFEHVETTSPDTITSARFRFGDKLLWIDKCPQLSQAEIWLEVITDDIENAARYFKESNCNRRDEIEPLPDGFKGFWLSNPANIIHLINQEINPENI